MEYSSKIGIMGGSFDPVHKGHVSLARDARDQVELDRVVVIPAGRQPFKLDRTPASGQDRMNMLDIAFAGERDISPCSYELDKDDVSYTYLTLKAMQDRFGPSARIYFIVGTDSLLKLESWKNSEELLTSYSYIVGSRPGYLDDELNDMIVHLDREYGTEIISIENQLFDVSSTEIRAMIAEGRPIADMVGEEVEEYIIKHGLYS